VPAARFVKRVEPARHVRLAVTAEACDVEVKAGIFSKFYQAAKLLVVKAGPVPTLALVRYAVIGGRPGPKTQTPLPLESPRQDTIYKLLIGVEGDSFSVSVNGQLVSAWTDHRLKSGGVGFFADKGEIANLRSIHVIDNQDFLGWLCYQVSWWTADRQKSGVTHE